MGLMRGAISLTVVLALLCHIALMTSGVREAHAPQVTSRNLAQGHGPSVHGSHTPEDHVPQEHRAPCCILSLCAGLVPPEGTCAVVAPYPPLALRTAFSGPAEAIRETASPLPVGARAPPMQA